MGGSSSKDQEKVLCMQLHNAILDGNEDVVRDLLLCGAISPNNKVFVHSRKLVLPLITAVENNCLPLVQILLEHDASTSVLNQEGNTPLHIAASQNLLQIAEMLLEHRADPCALNAHGETPLHIAATYGLANMALLLINCGASVNATGKHQRTALHSACAITGNNDMITTLVNNGIDLNAVDEDGRAPLHYLALLGKTQGIDILVQAGANKDDCDSAGKTALHFTVENQEVQATRSLIRHGCDVNIQDSSGHTPLHKAVEKEYVELVSILVQSGADPNLATTSGYFPLRIAVWKKNYDIAQKLLLNGETVVDACDRTGITALHVACLYALKENDEDMEMIELLLNNGADVNAQCSKHGRSPLHNAVEAKNDETVLLLLRNGADPNLTDNKGKSPRSMCTIRSISSLLDNVVTFPPQGNSTLSNGRGPTLTTDDQGLLNSSNSSQRSTNLYTPPNTRSNLPNNPPTSDSPPPPLPPRDDAFPPQPPILTGSLLPSSGLPQANVIRHNFVWSSLENQSNLSNVSSSSKVKVDVTSSTKLQKFPTSFNNDQSETDIFCYSISRSGQLLNTKLGCLLNIEPFSVDKTLLLYVQAHNYSTNLLPLSNSSRLCSNIIHFYTHYSSEEDFRQLDIQPEKIAPYFNKPIVVEFPLKNSAISMYNKHENEFKILVSYDEGSSWEESTSKVEKILINGDESDCAYLAVTETDELGMYAVILCSRRDVRSNVKLDDKVSSSVDPGINVNLNIDHDQTFTVAMSAECVPPTMLEKLHNQGFAYVLSCSRILSLQVSSVEATDSDTVSVSISLPISISHSSSHADVSYRILKKSEKVLNEGWQCCGLGSWEDVTQKDCQQVQISTKGKRLLGSTNNSPPHVSFDIALDTSFNHKFLVTAVRFFTASLTKHLVQVPEQIEFINSSANIGFLVHHKVTRLAEVVCDIVSSKDAEKIDVIYRDSGSYAGPPPSSAQVIRERNCITISPAGGIKFKGKSANKTRNLIFHSCLLPYSERFSIKGTASDLNTATEYVGFFHFDVSDSIDQSPPDSSSKPRSALNSESSVLVVENQAFAESSSSQSTSSQSCEKSSLVTLPFNLPRKHRLKINKSTTSSSGVDKMQLDNQVMELVCKRLDKAEFIELTFQLDIPKPKVDQAFHDHTDNHIAATLSLLQQWSADQLTENKDPVPQLCSALSCIGRENLSQDVARRCNPFVLEEVTNLAPLPEHVLQNRGSTLPTVNE